MSEYIVLLDPSIKDEKNKSSYNIGDRIIFKSVKKILTGIFPHLPLEQISAHGSLNRKEKKLITNSTFTFVGGTNILTSDVRNSIRLVPERKDFLSFLFPGIKNLILLGTGWCDYVPAPDAWTRIYYQRIFHHRYLHSIRDNYSVAQFNKAFFRNTVNTSCPTTWELNSNFNNVFNPAYGKIMFTLTDYNTNSAVDSRLIQTLFDNGQEEYIFFPQGAYDIDYLCSLDIYKKNSRKIKILNHSYHEFEQFVNNTRFNYIGTRLHAGIYCLKANNPVLIASIDNRATEIGKDIHLNVFDRNDIKSIRSWMENSDTPPSLDLPLKNIALWKNQFPVNLYQ